MRLIFLYGAPASGKLTVGKELAAISGFALFHNHLVVDAVASVLPFGSEQFVRLREQFWLAILGEAAAVRRSVIFTFAPEASVAPDFPLRIKAQTERAGGQIDFIRLVVSSREQERRLGNPDRAAFGKLRAPDLLRELRQQFADCETAMPQPALTIDTGTMSPTASARAIATALGLTCDDRS